MAEAVEIQDNKVCEEIKKYNLKVLYVRHFVGQEIMWKCYIYMLQRTDL